MTHSQPKLKSKGDGPPFRPFEVKEITKRYAKRNNYGWFLSVIASDFYLMDNDLSCSLTNSLKHGKAANKASEEK
jgi:hypothetical protein